MSKAISIVLCHCNRCGMASLDHAELGYVVIQPASRAKMDGLAQAVFSLTRLRLLAVRASGLRKLTAEIAVLSELRRLDVSRSRDLEVMEDIPWEQMTTLKSLDLSECRHLRVSTQFSGISLAYCQLTMARNASLETAHAS